MSSDTILDDVTVGGSATAIPAVADVKSLRAGWPRLLISLASPTQRGAPSFAFLAKGGYRERIRNGICAERTKVASAALLPAPSSGAEGTGHPRAQLPAAIRTHQRPTDSSEAGGPPASTKAHSGGLGF